MGVGDKGDVPIYYQTSINVCLLSNKEIVI